MAFEQRQYRDPLQVLLDAEAKTCKGCVHEMRIDAWEKKVWICKLKSKKHGNRCKFYAEAE